MIKDSRNPATASAFSDWVYRKARDARRGNREISKRTDIALTDQSDFQARSRMGLGRMTLQYVDFFIMWKLFHEKIGRETPGDWKLLFAHPHDGKPLEKSFKATALKYKGKPLGCAPDVILQNDKTNKFIIIDRVTTNVPDDFIDRVKWENIESQLWCYSHIDELQGAEEIILAGQIWRNTGKMFLNCSFEEKDECKRLGGRWDQETRKWFIPDGLDVRAFRKWDPHVMGRGVSLVQELPVWKKSDAKHEQRCLAWFEEYGGEKV
jgi:hypothetical protein